MKMLIIEWLRFFVGHPERMALASVLFAGCFYMMTLLHREYPLFHNRQLLVCSAIWLLLAIWEGYCQLREYNIRVDALFVYPAIMIVSIVGTGIGFANLLLSCGRKSDR
jgi:hypothetical protein